MAPPPFRQRLRQALQVLRRGYDAARASRRTRGWRATSGSPNAEILPQLKTLRDRSRDLCRNNAWAAAGLDVAVAYQIGAGIQARSNTGDAALDKRADAAFADWAARCDIAGRLDLWGLQALAARSRAEAGEALLLLVRPTHRDMKRLGLSVPLALQAIEADHLDDARNETLADGGVIRAGVECDARGRPRAYHLFRQHPGEVLAIGRAGAQAERIDASEVLHLLRIERPGQVRGVPDLAPVMARLRSLDELEDAALEQAKVQACLAALVISPAAQGRGPLEAPAEPNETEQRKTLAPGIIERLLPGEDVKFAEPKSGGSIEATAKHQLRAIAAGFGLTYDLLTGDLTEANYSSLRAGRLAFQRRLERLQYQVLIPQLVARIAEAWADAAQLAGVLPMRDGAWPFVYTPPRMELLDTAREAEGLTAMVRAGFLSWPEAVAQLGYDPRAQLEAIAAHNKALDAATIVLDTDPRRVAASGAAQDAKQIAAKELAASGSATTNA